MTNFAGRLRAAADQIAVQQQLTISDVYNVRRARLRRRRAASTLLVLVLLSVPLWIAASGAGRNGARMNRLGGDSGQVGTVSGQWELTQLIDYRGNDLPVVKASLFFGDFTDRRASGTLRVGGNVGALAWQAKGTTLTGILGIHSLVAFSDSENKVYELLTSMLSRGVSWQVDDTLLTLRGSDSQTAVFTFVGSTERA